MSLVAFRVLSCDIPSREAGVYARNASVGLSRAAFVAGYKPASAPITNPAPGAELSHHPRPSTQRVIVTDHSTPATHALPASFRIHEEFYVFKRDPRPRVHVLAELDTGHGGPDRPLVWCRRFGRGRVYDDGLRPRALLRDMAQLESPCLQLWGRVCWDIRDEGD
jgi:hypothetical protein